MGSSFCCMRSSPPPRNPGEGTCTILIIKSPERVAIRTKRRVYEGEEAEKTVVRGIMTLKECLLDSPNNNLGHHAINPTRLQVPNARSPPSQVMSSPEVRGTEFYTPRISFSSEIQEGKLEKVEEEEEEVVVRLTPILKRNGSEKLKKKVSFRVPEEADIFIFYSPKENFEDN